MSIEDAIAKDLVAILFVTFTFGGIALWLIVNTVVENWRKVRVAEKQTGGRARKAETERERGVYVYEIKTVSKDGSATVLVDPASGNVLRVDTPGFIASIANVFDRDDQRRDQAAFARLEVSSMALAGAIEAAEKETGGRAVEAALKSQDGSGLFEVRVVKDSAPQKVLVEPATGKVQTVPPHGGRKDDDD